MLIMTHMLVVIVARYVVLENVCSDNSRTTRSTLICYICTILWFREHQLLFYQTEIVMFVDEPSLGIFNSLTQELDLFVKKIV